MKRIEPVLKSLSRLYEFNKKLRTFTLLAGEKQTRPDTAAGGIPARKMATIGWLNREDSP